MLDRIIEKIFSSLSITVLVIGAFVFVIGAAGGLPIGDPPLQIVDLGWRISLAVLGLILVVAGLLFTNRELSTKHEPTEETGASFEIEARRFLDQPLLISSNKMNRQMIKSDFLLWEQCTIMMWVYVSEEKQGLRDEDGSPRFLLAHHTGKKGSETGKYRNRFSFRYSTKHNRWEVVFADDTGQDPGFSDRPRIKDGLETGWHHFLIAWDRSKSILRLLIDGGKTGNDLLSSPEAFSYWPEKLAGKLSVGAGLSNFKHQYCETRLFKILIFDSFLEASDSAVRQHLKQKPQA